MLLDIPVDLDRRHAAAALNVTFARTTYRPPAEPRTIETCFNQILGWAPVISDPIEQAFFVFVRVLYLQPFGMLAASPACFAVNIPLFRVRLSRVTVAATKVSATSEGWRGYQTAPS